MIDIEHQYYNVGKIVNTHGIKGEIRIVSVTDFEERFEPGNTLYYFKSEDTKPTQLTVRTHRKHKQFDLVSFEEFTSINDVESMKGGFLKVSEADQQPLEEDEFYYHEIIGCEVYLTDETYIGTIKEILSPGANDVWVIKRGKEPDALIPYIEQIVKEVDVQNKKVIIEPMEGLLS